MEYTVDKWTVYTCKCCTADWWARTSRHARASDWTKAYIDRIQSNCNSTAKKKKKERGGRGTIRSKLLPHEGGWESVVGIATPCGLDDPRIRTKAQPSSCTMDTWYFLEVWRPKGGADHPLPSTAGLRMGWSYTSASSLCLHSQVMGRPFPLHTMVRGS